MKKQHDTKILEDWYRLLSVSFPNEGWWKADSVWERCIGAVLCQGTTWHNACIALGVLRSHGLLHSPSELCTVSSSKLQGYLRSSGFYVRKASTLQALFMFFKECEFSEAYLRSQDIMLFRKDLMAIVGIGNETADTILLNAFEYPIFVVDTYTKRVLRRASMFFLVCRY